MKKQILTFGIILQIFTGCQQKTIEFGKNSFTIEKNISYGSDPKQKMNIYIPENTAQKKDVFIIIHGGGWRAGEKSQLTGFTHQLMKKFPQYIFVNMDYRLASTTQYALPHQTDDIKNVMMYLEKTLKIKPNYILLGNSAGGIYLCSMLISLIRIKR